MVLVPPVFDDMQLLQRVKDTLSPCGFGRFSVCTASEHDRLIAFTSQMPHVLSNAYIKSPTALSHSGFSAGSYKDLTRVAWLNPQMWAQLCLENRENMLFELNTYIESLRAYQKALQEQDMDTLTALLEEGRKRKEEVDG
jgi:prephenate dehydrogenase